MSSGIRGSSGAGGVSGSQEPDNKRPRRGPDSKTNKVAKEAIVHEDAVSPSHKKKPAVIRKRERVEEDVKIEKISGEAVQKKEKKSPYDKLLTAVIASEIPDAESQNALYSLLHDALEGEPVFRPELGWFDTAYALFFTREPDVTEAQKSCLQQIVASVRDMSPDERQDVLEYAQRFIQQEKNCLEALPQIIKALSQIVSENREKIVTLAKPFLRSIEQHFQRNMLLTEVAKKVGEHGEEFMIQLLSLVEGKRGYDFQDTMTVLSRIRANERLDVIQHARSFVTNAQVERAELYHVMLEVSAIPADKRLAAIECTKPLLKGVEEMYHRAFLLRDISKLPLEDMGDVINHAKPLLSYFPKETVQWGTLISLIGKIPKNERLQVLEEAKQLLPGVDLLTFIHKITLIIAQREAVNTVKVAKLVPQKRVYIDKAADPESIILAAVTRRKIKNVIETANKEKDLPLTPEEFEFLATRAIALRFSANAGQEFIQGIKSPGGDALSLSGYPRAHADLNKRGEVNPNWDEHVAPTNDPSEGPRILEERVKGFIKEFIKYGLPFYSKNENTRDYLELVKLKNNVQFLLGTFEGADNPYDLDQYYGLGKCGKQVMGVGGEGGKLIKRGRLGDDFFDNLPLSEQELNSTMDKTGNKIRQAIIDYIWKEVRLHIRKLALMNKAFPET